EMVRLFPASSLCPAMRIPNVCGFDYRGLAATVRPDQKNETGFWWNVGERRVGEAFEPIEAYLANLHSGFSYDFRRHMSRNNDLSAQCSAGVRGPGWVIARADPRLLCAVRSTAIHG